jgi:hypothetical protein
MDDDIEEYITKYESGELLTLIRNAIPYLKVNKKTMMKLHKYGLSHKEINEAVSEQYKNLTQGICCEMKALKATTKKGKKVEDAYRKEFFMSESVKDYLSLLQYKISHFYYKEKYNLNEIA